MEAAAVTPCNALKFAWEIQAAAATQGFDWPTIDGVLDKIEEELGEIRDALRQGDRNHAKRELGDLLLAAVNTARFLETDPATELLIATQRFQRRFESLSSLLAEQGRPIKQCSLDELDAVWNNVKTREESDGEKGS